MRIAKVIGTVTLNQAHNRLQSARWKLAVPLSLEDLQEDRLPMAEPIVVYDDLGAGIGSRILVSEGREASQVFHPEVKPIDAFNAGILDEVSVE